MSREAVLPSVFDEIAGLISYVSKVGSNEFAGSCPECGGSPHPDGSFPDRFRLFPVSKATGGPLGWCRSCGYTWVPGKGKGKEWRPDPETAARWEAERRQAEERRMSEAAAALDMLLHERCWETYHASLTPEVRATYRARGIPDDWQDYWELGYCPAFTVNYRDGEAWLSYESDTLSIPVFSPEGGPICSLRHRLLHPQRPQDRYRPGFRGLPAVPFIADRDRKLSGPLLVVEGEIKAMVTFITLDTTDLQVIGLPGKAPDLDMLAKFANCDPVYLALDPDAFVLSQQERRSRHPLTPAQRITQALGLERVRWMRLPDKIDDLIVSGCLGRGEISALLRGARRAY